MSFQVRSSESNGDCPLTILTPRENPQAREEGLRSGTNFFLEQPVDPGKFHRFWSPVQGLAVEESRDYHRVPLQSKVLCQWRRRKTKGQILNLSSKGMLIMFGEVPPANTFVKVGFTLRRCPEPFDLAAEVTRVDSVENGQKIRQVGVRFLNPE